MSGNTETSIFKNLMINILEKNIKDNTALNEKIKSAKLNFGPNFYVMIMEISQYISESNSLNAQLKSILPNSNIVLFKKNIVILLDIKDESSIDDKIIAKLENFLKENSMTMAISNKFSNILDMRKYYVQAYKTLKLANMLDIEGNLFIYENFKFYDLLNNIEKNINLKDFLNQAVLKLIDYDKEYNTEYFDTLKQYIKFNQNIGKTADEMFIHRNTLTYRLNKIKDILNIDFEDSETIFHVALSIKILEYLNKET